MPFIDSHAHLADRQFDSDRAEVLARAGDAGVECILNIANGTNASELEHALRVAEQAPSVWAAIGIHPHEARHSTPALLGAVKELAGDSRVLAVGEIGLDYHYDHSPRETQRAAFREQLHLAGELGLPVVIHCREAWSDCLEILEQVWAATRRGGILHCFSGSLDDARRARKWNFLISWAGNLTFPRAEELRAVAAELPLDAMLIETDCPYLAPQPVRGQRNEPAHVRAVAAELGRLKNLTEEEVGRVTRENFLRLFPRVAEKATRAGSARTHG